MRNQTGDDRSDGRGRLVIVATPIGNLGDLSPRAAETLRSADIVAAEDTRRTGKLLAEIGAETRQVSYHEHNEEQRLPDLVARMLDGETVALVTDAGTPGVSDPGFRLARACIDSGVDVVAVPGPSAVLHALVVSGLPTDRFAFDGFLPRRGGSRRERLAEIADEQRTLVLFASPHRVADDLRDLAEALGGERPAVLAREMTKMHEEVLRGTLDELAERAEAEKLRGEITLVVEGAARRPPEARSAEELVAEVELRVAAGVMKKQAIADVAREAGVPKREVYQAVVDAGGS